MCKYKYLDQTGYFSIALTYLFFEHSNIVDLHINLLSIKKGIVAEPFFFLFGYLQTKQHIYIFSDYIECWLKCVTITHMYANIYSQLLIHSKLRIYYKRMWTLETEFKKHNNKS